MREGSNLDQAYIKHHRSDFYRFFTDHDKRRGTWFLNTFPEMREFWEESKRHAR